MTGCQQIATFTVSWVRLHLQMETNALIAADSSAGAVPAACQGVSVGQSLQAGGLLGLGA